MLDFEFSPKIECSVRVLLLVNSFSVSDIENSVLDFEFDIRLNDIEEFLVSELTYLEVFVSRAG